MGVLPDPHPRLRPVVAASHVRPLDPAARDTRLARLALQLVPLRTRRLDLFVLRVGGCAMVAVRTVVAQGETVKGGAVCAGR